MLFRLEFVVTVVRCGVSEEFGKIWEYKPYCKSYVK